MENFINKLSSYNLLNHLFPGALFVIFINNFTSYSLKQETIILDVALYYFIGFILGRIGSLIVEPTFKKVRFLNFIDSSKFFKASIIDPKINELSETNNTYRTLCSGIIIAVITLSFYVVENYCYYYFSDFWKEYTALSLLLLLFGCAYRKQTKYIYLRVEKILNNEK